MKKLIDFLFKNKYTLALYFVLIGAIVSFSIGGIVFLIVRKDFWGCVLAIFGLFGAPFFVAALLSAFTKLPEDLFTGFSIGIYYGMMLVVVFIGGPDYDRPVSYIIGAVISSLVCYAVWRTKYKREYRDETDGVSH